MTSTLFGGTRGRLGTGNGEELTAFDTPNNDFAGILVSSGGQDASVVGGELVVSSTNSFRGIGLAFGAGALDGPGTYTLSLDLQNFVSSSAQQTMTAGLLAINTFNVDGFNFATPSNNILLDTDTGTVGNANGTASTISAGSTTFEQSQFTGPQTITLDINYDGSDALVIFIGAETNGFPFPVLTIDNISLSTVPEPSVSLLFGVFSLFVCTRRKRLA